MCYYRWTHFLGCHHRERHQELIIPCGDVVTCVEIFREYESELAKELGEDYDDAAKEHFDDTVWPYFRDCFARTFISLETMEGLCWNCEERERRVQETSHDFHSVGDERHFDDELEPHTEEEEDEEVELEVYEEKDDYGEETDDDDMKDDTSSDTDVETESYVHESTTELSEERLTRGQRRRAGAQS